MDPVLWAKVHGAMTHFPIALTSCSFALDGAGLCLGARAGAWGLHAAGACTMVLGALGSAAAVASGLMLTKGDVVGHGALRYHHLFVWPAFGLIVALGTWRLCIRSRATRRMLACYLAVAVAATTMVLAAGFWGGELLLAA
ncbi:MAG TPA: DUF2231 domain-containing protein [Planctomycetota bacterium]|nr:DUF2231 domain-containing protein [Planctomycetota bacterium]